MPSRSASSTLKSPVSTGRSPGMDQSRVDESIVIKQMKEDYDNYKAEKAENERFVKYPCYWTVMMGRGWHMLWRELIR